VAKAIKICLNLAMILLVAFQMAYLLVGLRGHERLGSILVALVVAHLIINRSAFLAPLRGHRTPARIFAMALGALALLAIIALAVSGVTMSAGAFGYANAKGWVAKARIVHLVCAYWGFILISVHLGLHWKAFLRLFRKPASPSARPMGFGAKKISKCAWVLPFVVVAAMAAFGAVTFFKREIASYLFLRVVFAYFDLNVPLWRYVLENLAIMGLFATMGYCLGKLLKLKKTPMAKKLNY
jgi:hypothetical protein